MNKLISNLFLNKFFFRSRFGAWFYVFNESSFFPLWFVGNSH